MSQRKAKKVKIRIKIKSSQKKITLPKKSIERLVRYALRLEDINKAELSILFVGKKRMRSLNARYRNIDKPTDVLAFGMREGKDAHLHPEILGDIVICPEVTYNYARAYGNTKKNELYLDVVHGILHLLGYDDSKSAARTKMQKTQERILNKVLKKL